MNFRLLWAAVVVGGTVSVAVAASAYRNARHASTTRLSIAMRLAGEAAKLRRLQQSSQRWTGGPRQPQSGLAARLADAIAAAGLPATTLENVSPEPESVVVRAPANTRAASLKRQRANLTLAPLTLPQLGAFLSAWGAREPGWTVATIDLSQDMRHRPSEAGGDLMLRAVLTLDAIYLAGPSQKGGSS